jgi:hypothetical protein
MVKRDNSVVQQWGQPEVKPLCVFPQIESFEIF